ncbi:protein kinase [Streptomyces sp. NPDC015237]|uniref:phosphorylase family protein n=1 Tax=Streptomyces sp. NPDC015237 TaxID=3364949 RepID=UPI0036F87BA1
MAMRERAVVLTATIIEYRAVVELLEQPCPLNSASGAPYTVGTLAGSHAGWDLWVACVGQGNVNAALQASQAISELQPELIAFLGTAGSLKPEVCLGDVVFATKVYGYEAGKQTDDGLLARPEVAGAHPQLAGFARRIAASEAWNAPRTPTDEGLDSPRVHVEPIAAGEKIQTGQQEALRKHLRASFNDAVAVEMEGLGFLTATHQWSEAKAMVIRGISDRLADKSADHDQQIQPVACRNAARFLAEVLADCASDAQPVHLLRQIEARAGRGRADAKTFIPAGLTDSRAVLTWEDVPSHDLAGLTVGTRYHLLREIGRGSLNAVWEAEERAFNRTLGKVAVKLQPPDTGKRFRYFSREAATMATFDCPYLLPYRTAGTMDAGELEGWSYIATGLAQMSLRNWINEDPLQGSDLLAMMLDVARALTYLHASKLVHGDVKPANILRYVDRWVVGDFGLTQPSGAHEPEGTLGYMAPERFEGRVVTSNDVYSWAVTSVVAANGMWRNDLSTVDSTMGRVASYLASNIPTRPQYRSQSFPRPIADLLSECFETDPADRPTMQDLVKSLEYFRT